MGRQGSTRGQRGQPAFAGPLETAVRAAHIVSPAGKNLVWYARRRGYSDDPAQWTPEQRAELESDRTAYFAEQHARAEKGRRLKKAMRLRAEAAEIEALYGGESA